jgi:hypothetical protein
VFRRSTPVTEAGVLLSRRRHCLAGETGDLAGEFHWCCTRPRAMSSTADPEAKAVTEGEVAVAGSNSASDAGCGGKKRLWLVVTVRVTLAAGVARNGVGWDTPAGA